MKIHHLNCGSSAPLGGKLMGGTGHPLRAARSVSHCLLIETDRELILVDSGFGTGDIEDPVGRLGKRFLRLARPVLSYQETALHQLRALGYHPRDLRHIVLTHVDPDHAGGISDFPDAKVHVLAAAHAAATAPPGRRERSRARANQRQWAHGPNWVTYDSTGGDRWFGFDGVRPIEEIAGDIVLVPLPGHSHGHTGVAVRTGDDGDGSKPEWILHAGDAYLFHSEVDVEHPSVPFAIGLFERRQQVDARARVENQARLRALINAHGDQVRVICAHDPSEYESLSNGRLAVRRTAS